MFIHPIFLFFSALQLFCSSSLTTERVTLILIFVEQKKFFVLFSLCCSGQKMPKGKTRLAKKNKDAFWKRYIDFLLNAASESCFSTTISNLSALTSVYQCVHAEFSKFPRLVLAAVKFTPK